MREKKLKFCIVGSEFKCVSIMIFVYILVGRENFRKKEFIYDVFIVKLIIYIRKMYIKYVYVYKIKDVEGIIL